ncbi:hypothetical protein [Thiofilum flexile]|uniref:hypothetical protein n=1 Tax=Thiofilum flexile TaxID=125627 RepID=UPI00038199E5|nr:hypothetical protein [Thiofilum flexile]
MSEPINPIDPSKPRASSLLDYYHCTFFLPLLGFGEGLEPREALRQIYPYDQPLTAEDAQAFYYLTPTLRDIIFDRGNISLSEDKHRLHGKVSGNPDQLIPVREWRLEKQVQLENWRLVLHPSKWQSEDIAAAPEKKPLFHQEAVFTSVRLYRYFNGIYLLAFTVEPQALVALRKSDNVSLFGDPDETLVPNNWESVESNDPHRSLYTELQLEAWLRFTRLARQLYPSFTEQGDENKVAPLELITPEKKTSALEDEVPRQLPKVAEHISPIIVHLVQQFFTKPIEQPLKESIRLFDDRMFVSVAYGLAGKKYDDLHQVRALLATTDRFADTWDAMQGYAYSKEAVDEYLKDSEFGFWTDMGGYYVFNDMVNAYLYNGSFFRDVIAPKHIPYIYDRMLLQALFYQASLRHYDHQITQRTTALLSEKDEEKANKQIQEQRADFIRFTNQYWFREVSNQMQGKMIFRLQYQGVGIDEYYQQLQDEITRTNDYLQVLYENRAADEANRLADEANKAGKRANKLAVVALFLAVFAALSVINDVFKVEPSMWQGLASWFGDSCTSAGLEADPPKCSISLGIRIGLLLILGLLVGAAYLCIPAAASWIKNKFFHGGD